MKRGMIVLCGGKSSRMGYPKAMLPFGPEPMLRRVLQQVSLPLTSRIVVAADDQPLPALPADVIVARDLHPERGPLEAIAAGLAAGKDLADAYYITSCDVPLLRREWVQGVFGHLGLEDDIVVPVDDNHHHPLAAVYRSSVLPLVQELLAADQRRPLFLFSKTRTKEVRVEQLQACDPERVSLMNVNSKEDYLATMRIAGFEPSDEILQRLRECP